MGGVPLETIIASCITAAVTLTVCLITNHAQSQKTVALIEYRLNELAEAVRRHNNLIDRIYHLETESQRHSDELVRVNHRLEILEDDNK